MRDFIRQASTATATKLGKAYRRATAAYRRATAAYRAAPEFIIVGAQKAGTGVLFIHLSQHPAVVAPTKKEIHYFDLEFGRGAEWYRAQFPLRSDLERVSSTIGARAITGEASPYYMFHPLAPERIARMLPDVKLIALLRDPVTRAYSHYNQTREKGLETLSFEEAIAREEERLRGERERMIAAGDAGGGCRSPIYQRHSYCSRGMYARQLERLFELFGRDRVYCIQSERYKRDVQGTFDGVCQFLGLPSFELRDTRPQYVRAYDHSHIPMEAELRSRFAEPNEELFRLLGYRMDWPTAVQREGHKQS